jgi:hypothetical protein
MQPKLDSLEVVHVWAVGASISTAMEMLMALDAGHSSRPTSPALHMSLGLCHLFLQVFMWYL